jgi:hypothetical protein
VRDPFLWHIDSKRSVSDGLNRSSYLTLAMALPHDVAHYRSGLYSLHLLRQESLYERKRDASYVICDRLLEGLNATEQCCSNTRVFNQVQRPHLVDFE